LALILRALPSGWLKGRETSVRKQLDEDVTPTPREVDQMAAVLEGRHGVLAAQVADFFADFNERHGDAGRAWAWTVVGEHIRRRTDARQQSSAKV
jgi:hypothetical protein